MRAFWAALMVRQSNEFDVRDDLRLLQVKSYLPIGKRYTKPKKKRKPIIMEFAAFPGYIFIYVPKKGIDYAQVRDVKNVKGFVHWNGRIGMMTSKIMQTLKKAEKAGMFDDNHGYIGKLKKYFSVGEQVKVLGVFEGMFGIIDECLYQEQKAWVSVGPLKAKISLDFLEKIVQ